MRLAIALLASLMLLASAFTPATAYIQEPVFTDAWIIDPQYSRPAFINAGEEATLTLSCSGQCEGQYTVELVSFNKTYTLPAQAVIDEGLVKLMFTVPVTVEEDLYDSVVYLNGERIAWMPRNFYVKHGTLDKLVIMHMSDIHLGASDKGIDNIFKNTRYVMLSYLLKKQYNVTFAIITGDIADVGSDVPSLKAIWMEFNQFRIPTYMVPGNHDWAQVPNLEAFLNNFYGRYVNSREYWYTVIDDFLVIGLDSMGSGYLTFEEIRFVNETLSKYPDKKAILAFHHPIFNRPGTYSGPVDNWIGSVYSSWAEHRANLEAFMNVITSHDNVVAVLSGHIHRDADAIFKDGDQTIYFIATTTANHGTPTYWGTKLIEVYKNGTVNVILPPGKDDLFSGRTSWNTEYVKTYEITNSDHTTVVWEASASRFVEFNLSRAPLLFYMNASQGPYQVYDKSGIVEGYEVYEYGDYLVYLVWARIPTDSKAYVIVSNTNDTTPPTVDIGMISPSNVIAGRTKIKAYIYAGDEGWGIAEVKLLYRVDGGQWKEVTPTFYKTYYLAQIGPFRGTTLELKAVAVDYNGNTAESQTVSIELKQPPTPPTTQEQPTQQQEQAGQEQPTGEMETPAPETPVTEEQPQINETTTTPETGGQQQEEAPAQQPTQQQEPAAQEQQPAGEAATGDLGPDMRLIGGLIVLIIVVLAAFFVISRR